VVTRKSAEFVVLKICFVEVYFNVNNFKEGTNHMLDLNYIVGFVDGEGCFCVTINHNGLRLPEVRLLFEIELQSIWTRWMR
jgi:hypothetical protein